MQMVHAVKYHHYAPHHQVYMAEMHAKQKAWHNERMRHMHSGASSFQNA